MKRSTLNLPRFGSGIGLHRVHYAAESLGISLDKLSKKSIVVTGTNGKGTVAKALSEIARYCGRSTALFTSPHTFEFNERFCINGNNISDDALEQTATIVSEIIDHYEERNPHDKFGEFEAWFLQALCIFDTPDIDFIVFEAGIGGRYDPTRIIRPRLSCITSIDLEHTELLGNSTSEIILDKLDIAPPSSKIVLGEGLLAHKKRVCTVSWLKGVKSIWSNEIFDSIKSTFESGNNRIQITWRDGASSVFHTPMLGRFAAENIALSCALYRLFFGESHFGNSQEAISRALLGLNWPGRFERIAGEVDFLIDFAHTPKAIEGTLADLSALFNERPKVFLVGVSKGRERSRIIEEIASSGIDFVAGASHKGMLPEEIKSVIEAKNSEANVLTFQSPDEAYRAAVELANEKNAMICVLGGYFWGATIRALTRNKDFRAIDFS